MRLEGTLDAFGLPDILQLLAFTRKTGALQLSAAPAAGVVRVREGAICGASSDVTRQVLARRVVGAGLVGDDALQAAVGAAASGTTGVVAALLADGALSVEQVLPLATEQTVDAVGELLRWTGGEFSFVVDAPDPEALPLQLSVEDVVAEGKRRLAVWADLTTVIPSLDVALTLAVAPAEDPQCSREEWGLLALVDGTRTVREIVALLGRSEFAVTRSLAALVSRGLLVVPGASGPGGGLPELQRRQALLAELEVGPSAAVPAQATPPQATPPQTIPAHAIPAQGLPAEPALAHVAMAADGANVLTTDGIAAVPVAVHDEAAAPVEAPAEEAVVRSLLFRVPGLG
jgi:Domain of unknown function (DUF4388)